MSRKQYHSDEYKVDTYALPSCLGSMCMVAGIIYI